MNGVVGYGYGYKIAGVERGGVDLNDYLSWLWSWDGEVVREVQVGEEGGGSPGKW